ncbi:hypothetical protein ODJ70_24675 [Pseudomonas aeruginosa]|uniref:hypothetical protein n=1 Tax=Pseudomonas aeruginosa group TaxID=136841 RepID=UPI000F543B23|nr:MULTISPECIES: hypothetical protein [Pseudomonas aeruginosa group]EKX5733262.1 hypothetical protein [Pseudomonas aeruginosa]MEB3868741.1 hypothetical protein [Pseudomonas aeruginosa]MEB3892797.1 hypothetical protein [Pseudomonas aeruginosa]MEB3916218.1 hypothetical protein [Pseudomonas aeruginosa]MEB3941353.1 hypothetical protein [Pseudomonas aeruginosa]
MTCIIVAHLGREVLIAADKRVTYISEDGARTPIGDSEEKIVRTAVGVVTGCGAIAMLQPVKDLLSRLGFGHTDEVLELIQKVRKEYSEVNASCPHLQADLAETSWIFTYPTATKETFLTRVAFFHQSINSEKLSVVHEGKVMCFPSGVTLEQAQELQAQLQEFTTYCLGTLPHDQARQEVISLMLRQMNEVAQISTSVSSACDVAIVTGRDAYISMSANQDEQMLQFSLMPHSL